MKGVVVDCRTGEIREIDDGLPISEAPPYIEPIGIDLLVLTEKLKKLDIFEKRIKTLEDKIK